MTERNIDIAIIGGGAAGLTAAARCAEAGARTLVVERMERLGGVLRQCIHNGFGLHYFKEEMTGPEYASRVHRMAEKAGAGFMLESTVVEITPEKDGGHCLLVYSHADGVVRLHAKAVILAMGCRERCRGNLGIPGDRTAGVYSAGAAQQMLNMEGMLPGRRAVIVGSGDIGLIMARRLTWCGVKVECVIEIMPYPAGLSRNIAQCLEDFGIPLYLGTGVTGIHGVPRVQYVTYAPLVDGKPDLARERRVDCDTVLFSVGLVPENELSRECGCRINPLTNGAWVDGALMTSVPGIFSCGNVLHVHDLVDFVSQEAERCADSAVAYSRRSGDGHGSEPMADVTPGDGVRYVVPNRVAPQQENRLLLRSRNVMESAEVAVCDEKGKTIVRRKLRYVKPAEMLEVRLPAFQMDDGTKAALTVTLQEVK